MSRHTSRDEQTHAALHLGWVVFDICVGHLTFARPSILPRIAG